MCAHKPEIIVAGCGIAGAAVSLFLSRLDTNFIVLESRPGRPRTAEGGILMLAPNGMNVLNGLGLAQTLLQRENGISLSTMTITDSAGGLLGKVPHGSEKRHGFESTMMLRSELQTVLLDDMEKRQINIRWGAQVQSVEECNDGVLVRWTENGQAQEKKVDLLIGADGIWSAVRSSVYESLGLPVHKPEYTGLLGMGMIIDIDDVPGLSDLLTTEQPCVMMHGQRGSVAATLFEKKRKKASWWTTHEVASRARDEWKITKEQALTEMRERYLDWAFPVPQLIAAAEASENEPLILPMFGIQRLEKWHSRRIVLVGDAAHAMSSSSGQGASQALEDAAYLGHLLREELKNAPSVDWTSMLARFQTDRQPRVNKISDEASRRGDRKKDLSAFGYLMKRWIMWIAFNFIRESWGDSWFGYKVPGIDEW